jgi:hypothetical protein
MSEAECYARCYGGAHRIEVIRRARSSDEDGGESGLRASERRRESRDREAA